MGRGGAISDRDRIRDRAAALLRVKGGSIHVSEIAREILPALGLAESVTTKTVNTCLHDDPQRRFFRVEKGTWKLSSTPRSPA